MNVIKKTKPTVSCSIGENQLSKTAVTDNSDQSIIDPAVIDCLLQHYGIAENFIEYSGNTFSIPQRDRLKILELMGVAVDDPVAVNAAFHRINCEQYLQWLPPVIVLPSHCDQSISLKLIDADLSNTINWRITTEEQDIYTGSVIAAELTESHKESVNGLMITTRQLAIPNLPLGYHHITLSNADLSKTGEEYSSHLIITPDRCFEPQWVIDNRKLSGLSVQVYSLRSNRNWGIGDFSDLKLLIEKTSSVGIDFLTLNPLHFLDANKPEHCSPYSPMDRRRLNPLYIDPQLEPGMIDNPKLQQEVHGTAYQRRLAKLRAPEFVDYSSVTATKYAVFAKMFAYFKTQHIKTQSSIGLDFENYLIAQGNELQTFANFLVDRNSFAFPQCSDPQFHCYLQWIAERQLEACQQLAKQSGMEIGLIRDMAIGGDTNSAEVALNQDLFCTQASIGAPPDPLAPQGQNWGLPPLKPKILKQTGFHHFIELLRTNISHCGALRIDHVMGLLRLWWCPITESCSKGHGEGAYVFYPVDELFAILRLESQRQQCVVIGEDLGVVPPEIRSHMSDSGVFSNVLFYFEKYDPVHFKRPEHFPFKALAMVANHDVPTLMAWWNKSDLATRRQIGLLNDDEIYETTLRARESDLIQILHWLNEAGNLPSAWHDFNIHRAFDQSLCRAILLTNAQSAAQLVSAQLDDLCLTESPVNIPGTWNEYPNWRRKLPCSIDDLSSDISISELLSTFAQARSLP